MSDIWVDFSYVNVAYVQVLISFFVIDMRIFVRCTMTYKFFNQIIMAPWAIAIVSQSCAWKYFLSKFGRLSKGNTNNQAYLIKNMSYVHQPVNANVFPLTWLCLQRPAIHSPGFCICIATIFSGLWFSFIMIIANALIELFQVIAAAVVNNNIMAWVALWIHISHYMINPLNVFCDNN